MFLQTPAFECNFSEMFLQTRFRLNFCDTWSSAKFADPFFKHIWESLLCNGYTTTKISLD